MSDAKITALTENTTPLATDLLAIVDDPAGTPATQKVTVQNVLETPLTVYAHGNCGATETFDYTNGAIHSGTVDADLTVTLAWTGVVSGDLASMELLLLGDGSHTISAWPGEVTWDGGTAPTFDVTLNAINRFLFETTDAGTTVLGAKWGGGGAMATDALWDAAGDLAVGTGANTATRLAVGASGEVPTSNGTTLAYALPPGYEFDYAEITSPVNITGTSEGSETTLITGASVTYDGSTTILVQFYAVDTRSPSAAAGNAMVFLLYDGATLLGRIGLIITPTAGQLGGPARGEYRYTPTNAAHQYIVKAYVSNTTGTPSVQAGAGGSGTALPAFLRVTKV